MIPVRTRILCTGKQEAMNGLTEKPVKLILLDPDMDPK